MVVIVTLKAALLTRHWTKFAHLAIWSELGVWFVWTLLYFTVWKWNGLGDIAHEVSRIPYLYFCRPHLFILFIFRLSFLSFPVRNLTLPDM
jgi:hypothetical protein